MLLATRRKLDQSLLSKVSSSQQQPPLTKTRTNIPWTTTTTTAMAMFLIMVNIVLLDNNNNNSESTGVMMVHGFTPRTTIGRNNQLSWTSEISDDESDINSNHRHSVHRLLLLASNNNDDTISSSLPDYSNLNNNDNEQELLVSSVSSSSADTTTTTASTDGTTTTTTTTNSFGSMLMQLQKQEEEALLMNETPPVLDVATLDPLIPTTTTTETADGGGGNASESNRKDDESSRSTASNVVVADDASSGDDSTITNTMDTNAAAALDSMDWETAKALDQTVTTIIDKASARATPLRLPLAPLYQNMIQETSSRTSTSGASSKSSSVPLPPLSRREHYQYRMGRNLRQLVVSIAASCDSVDDWRQFVVNTSGGGTSTTTSSSSSGGLYDILLTIQESAMDVSPTTTTTSTAGGGDGSDTDYSDGRQQRRRRRHGVFWQELQREREALQLAGAACRALRDLCALSPNLSAVLADGMLRMSNNNNGNTNNDGGSLFTNLDTLLQAASRRRPVIGRLPQQEQPQSNMKGSSTINSQYQRCQLYILQLLLAVIVATDDAVSAIRSTPGLIDTVLACSSYESSKSSYARSNNNKNGSDGAAATTTKRQKLWQRLTFWRKLFPRRNPKQQQQHRRLQLAKGLEGEVQKVANQVLAAVGHNTWHRRPGQRGLRVLCLDGGGSRGMTAVTAVHGMMQEAASDLQVSDAFDLICGTSTGGIIAFLTGLLRETSAQAVERYNQLIKQIFVKPFLSTPLMVFTTASYDESPFMNILQTILQDKIMLDSRADPRVPLVCCLTSKMSSTPTHVALFRNYNYHNGELPDPFTIDPDRAREELGLPLEKEHPCIRNSHYSNNNDLRSQQRRAPGESRPMGSRHPGSFRVLQRYALRASTAAPTVFKPVMMGGEMYCDGGIVASNPAAVAIHEARALFPDVPIELVVSVGTGKFLEQKSAPRIGWDGIIGQIVGSATDGEQVHHVLEDVLGSSSVIGNKDSSVSRTRYFRFNPVLGLPDAFPIDVTDPEKLAELRRISRDYMKEPKQLAKLREISKILAGKA